MKRFPLALSLRNKLLLSFLFLILLPISCYTMASYNQITDIIREQMAYSSRQAIDQTAQLLSNRVENILYVSDQILYSDEIREILLESSGKPVCPQILGNMNRLDKLLITQFKKSDMDRLTLYIEESIFFAHSQPSASNLTDAGVSSLQYIEDESWYRRLTESGESSIWLPPSYNQQVSALKERVVSYIRLIHDNQDYSRILALLRIDLLESKITAVARGAVSTPGGAVFLQNADGEILASSNGQTAPDSAAGAMMTYTAEVPLSSWTLTSSIPHSHVSATANQSKRELLFVMAFSTFLSYGTACGISTSISRRVNTLTKRIQRVQYGDFSSIIDVTGHDEISELSRNYNYMLRKLTFFSKEQYRSGQELKNAELRALQAQINPHFLYNTLDVINWTALTKGVPEVSDIVLSLSRFYKLSLNGGQDVVTLAKEVEHIKAYVRIQNYRYPGAIHLTVDLPSDLEQQNVPKLILQPLVENSIHHGILETVSRSGSISLTGRFDSSSIVLLLQDDGAGLSPDQCLRILQHPKPNGGGFGVYNVNNRIKLACGEAYGLSYESPREGGCLVAIRLPAGLSRSSI